MGTFGKVACFSLNPLKNLHAFGDGGVITTDDEALYRSVLINQVVTNPRLAEVIQFTEATTIDSAIRMSSETSPDVIVMDIDFGDPTRNGYDAIERIRENGVKACICIHSNRAHSDQSIDRKSESVALPKPISRTQFLKFLASSVAH